MRWIRLRTFGNTRFPLGGGGAFVEFLIAAAVDKAEVSPFEWRVDVKAKRQTTIAAIVRTRYKNLSIAKDAPGRIAQNK